MAAAALPTAEARQCFVTALAARGYDADPSHIHLIAARAIETARRRSGRAAVPA